MSLCCIPWVYTISTQWKERIHHARSSQKVPPRFWCGPGRYATGTWFQDWIAMCWHGLMQKVTWDKVPIYYVGGCVCVAGTPLSIGSGLKHFFTRTWGYDPIWPIFFQTGWRNHQLVVFFRRVFDAEVNCQFLPNNITGICAKFHTPNPVAADFEGGLPTLIRKKHIWLKGFLPSFFQ